MNAHLFYSHLKRALLKVGIFFLFFLSVSHPLFAAVDQATNGLALDASKLPGTSTDCATTCSLLGNYDPSNNQYGNGIRAGTSWTTWDDQYCANHGSVTNTSVGPNTVACTANLDSTCNVPYCSTETCTVANANLRHCKLKNSQAQSYCQSYLVAKAGRENNFVAVALDASATGICGTACTMEAAPGLGATLAFCAATGAAASLNEIISTTQMQESDLAKTITYMGSAIGLGAAGVTLAKAGQKGAEIKKAEAEKKASAGTTTDPDPSAASKGETALADAGKAVDKSEGGLGQLSKSLKNKEACASALLFGIMTGVRMYNIQTTQDTMNSSCTSLQSLISTATAASSTSDINSSNYTPTNGITTTSGSGAAINSASNSTSGGSGTPTPLFTPCSSSTGSSECPNWGSAAALDSGALTNSGGVPSAGTLAKQLADNGLENQIASGATAGQVVGAALGGGGGGGSFGQAVANLADQVQQNPQDAMAFLPAGALPVYSSGGGGRGSSGGGGSKSGDNPFAGLFNQGAKKEGPGSTNAMSFSGGKVSDIWHTGVKMTLFDIVSQRVLQVSSRVQP